MAVTHLGFFQVFSKKMWKWVRKCEFANLRTSTCNVRAGVFLAKKIVEMCAKVQMCEISHVRTPARLQNVCNVHGVAAGVFFFFCKKIFGKKNSGSHTMHIAHILQACGCADVRNFAHPHFHTHFQKFFCKKKLWQPHHARCTHFARVRVCGRAKFRTSALSHTYPKFFLQKKTLAATPCTLHTFCTRAGVRTCEFSHIRTFTHISKICHPVDGRGAHLTLWGGREGNSVCTIRLIGYCTVDPAR